MFCCQKRLPVKSLSNNRLTFKAAGKMISSILERPTVKEYFAWVCVQWSFSLEKAPWSGRIFGWMVKRCLCKTIGRGRLELDELHTLITEVEAIINSKPPLHILTEDADDITPSHLITGCKLMTFPDRLYYKNPEDDFLEYSVFTKQLIELNKLFDHFWMKLKTEYLSELRNAHRRLRTVNMEVKRPIKVG